MKKPPKESGPNSLTPHQDSFVSTGRGVDPQIHALLSKLWDREGFSQELSSYRAHFWQQALDKDPNAVLIPHNPTEENYGHFAGNRGDFEHTANLIDIVMSNRKPFVENFKRMVQTLDVAKELQEKSLVIPTNHQSYFNPAFIAHGLAAAMHELYDFDVRDNIEILIGPRMLTTEFNGLYIPDVITQFSNWRLVFPDTSRGHVPGASELIDKVNKAALRAISHKKMHEPGSIFIIAPSGMTDLEDGSYEEKPSNASMGLVSPTRNSVTWPIAIGDKGIMEMLANGNTLDVHLAFGPVFKSGRIMSDKGYGADIVNQELYGSLVDRIGIQDFIVGKSN